MSKKSLSTTLFAVIMLFGLGCTTTAQAFSIKLPAFMGGQVLGTEDDRGESDDNKGPRGLLSQKREDREDDDRPGIRMMIGQGITGTVTAVSQTSITVNGKHASTTGAFVVDITTAKFFKNNATTTLASILVGDTVTIQGPVSGMTAVAVSVYDGKLPAAIQKVEAKREEKKEDRKDRREDRIADHLKGSAILGVVTSVNGSTILVDGKMGTSTATTTYTVDATNAKVFKNKATTTISAILAGDKVLVEGTVNGTSITANFIYDGKLPLNGRALSAITEEPLRGKFAEKINNFFKKFFRRDK